MRTMMSPLARARSIAASLATCALVGCVFLVVGCAEPPPGPMRGQALYDACVSCHGQDGAGNPKLEAPPIAGLPQWYLESQLMKFRISARGAHPRDAAGLRMRPMSLALPTDDDVKFVASYVASMPIPPRQDRALAGGDAAKGAATFAQCTACHGADGAGNQAMNAPPIKQMPDWYLFAQLKKFKEGVRGAHPKDATGATMRPFALGLVDEQAMRDVTDYVMTLK